MKQLVTLLLCSSLVHVVFAQETSNDTLTVKALNAYAIQEDVATILQVLDTVSPQRLTPSLQAVKMQYFNRFRYETETLDTVYAPLFIRQVLTIYHAYWRLLLLKKVPPLEADRSLGDALTGLLQKEKGVAFSTPGDSLVGTLTALAQFFTQQGYFSYTEERTGNLYDLLLWKTQDTVAYTVQLPEGVLSVPVYFMKGILTLGWIEYASVGNATPGGWPKNGGLYCVAKSYDTTSEKFKVSFLQHEAQHFWDQAHYGKLPSWRLEYRAKLAELAAADSTLFPLLTNFSIMAKPDSTLPHPYGSYLVLHNLTARLEKQTGKKWKTGKEFTVNELQVAALYLLREDSKKLGKEKRGKAGG